jgi:uncharacterized NAD(P)/FAD-binding protein YdhS
VTEERVATVADVPLAHRQTADLAIVGAGVSGAQSLLAVLDQLSSAPTRQKRIVVIERHPAFFSGVAYGPRSGPGSLTLSTLERFLPNDERAEFVEWLDAHCDDVLHAVDIDEAWVDRHRHAIVEGRWESLYIPRRLYGRYLAERVEAAIALARSEGVADVACVNAEVTKVVEAGDRYMLAVDSGDETFQIDAAVVVLSIGSPPVQRLTTDDDAPADAVVCDIYDPGLEQTLTSVERRLAALPRPDRSVLVVGGNAAAIEFVLAARTLVRNLAATITVLSPSGRPRHWHRKSAQGSARLPALMALRTSADAGRHVSASDLYEAVAADLSAAVASGTDLSAVPAIVETIPSFLGKLDSESRTALAAEYGMRMTNLLREDCGDAIDIMDASVAAGVIGFETGRYRSARCVETGFEVEVSDDDGTRTLDRRYGVIVGAVGFEAVSTTRAGLIRQLLDDGIARSSGSDRGFEADSRFQAADRLFVTGPLLAGNANISMLIWHAESVRRILEITAAAAPAIVGELHAVSSDNSLSV